MAELTRELGAEAAREAHTDLSLVTQALQGCRPDLLHFLKTVTRQNGTLVLGFSHPAAAQEAAMHEPVLLRAIEAAAGARIAGGLRCRAGK